MTRYDQLTDQALSYAHENMDYYENCQRLAFRLATAYATFLDCPHDRIVFIRLDQNLDRTEESDPIGFEGPLTLWTDGFWYFCARIRYEKAGDPAYGYEFIKLGLRLSERLLTIREDKDFEIDPDNVATAEPLFVQLFQTSLRRFASPPYVQSKQIGFA
jgi:hypothetical protein